MTRVLIPYSENNNRSILIALNSFKEYGNMKLEQMAPLIDQFFHNKKDIHFDVPNGKLKSLLNSLKAEGFIYQTIEM